MPIVILGIDAMVARYAARRPRGVRPARPNARRLRPKKKVR